MTWATSELARAHGAANGAGWPGSAGVAAGGVPFTDALSRMTHEIRTPLNAVIGFAALMQRELHGALGSDRYREYVGHIAECGSRLVCATEQALLLARTATEPTVGRTEPVALRDVVALSLALENTVGRAEARGPVCVGIDGDCTVTVDPEATRFAIANLVAVARRHGDAGSTVGLTSRVECGMLALDVTGSGWRARSSGSEGHLAIARRLLEMQGLDLVTSGRDDVPWSARIVFADTAQLQLI